MACSLSLAPLASIDRWRGRSTAGPTPPYRFATNALLLRPATTGDVAQADYLRRGLAPGSATAHVCERQDLLASDALTLASRHSVTAVTAQRLPMYATLLDGEVWDFFSCRGPHDEQALAGQQAVPRGYCCHDAPDGRARSRG